MLNKWVESIPNYDPALSMKLLAFPGRPSGIDLGQDACSMAIGPKAPAVWRRSPCPWLPVGLLGSEWLCFLLRTTCSMAPRSQARGFQYNSLHYFCRHKSYRTMWILISQNAICSMPRLVTSILELMMTWWDAVIMFIYMTIQKNTLNK